MPPLHQMTGDDECIAAVVAGPREDENRPAAVADQFAREFSRCQTGALHERRISIFTGERLDAADLIGQINRKRGVREERHACERCAV
jgi:hypothetical protein